MSDRGPINFSATFLLKEKVPVNVVWLVKGNQSITTTFIHNQPKLIPYLYSP